MNFTEDAKVTSDYAIDTETGILYFIFDLSDAEGEMKTFRIDITGAYEGTLVYLTDMAFFASEDDALTWCGYSEDEETTQATTEAPTQEQTQPESDSEIQTAPPVSTEKEGCGSIVGAGLATVAMIALGALCIKKKD